ncbi:MAG: RHS repeat-associated core domain-containing protein [Chlamydiota bacterium]
MCFLFLILSLSAAEKETHIAKNLSSKESPFKGHNLSNHPGTVDIITGAFTEEHVDFFTKGPEPILLARTWKNGTQDSGNLGGWGLNNYHKSALSHKLNCTERLIFEPYGGGFAFTHPCQTYRIKAHTGNFNQGFINTGLGEISGATTAKSMSALMDKGILSVIDPDGTKRIMHHHLNNIYQTALEKRPHYRELRYTWQNFKGSSIFSSISSWGRAKEFNHIDFALESASSLIVQSRNRQIRYSFEPKNGSVLTEVTGANGPDFVKYSYSADGRRIERREAPEGRYLDILYDRNDKVSTLLGPGGEDGSPAVLSRYFIQEHYGRDDQGRKNKKFKGITSQVWDAAGHVKQYNIDESNRVRKIVTFKGESEPLASENVVWNRAYDKREVGDFVCRFIVDEKKHTYAYAKTIDYDKQHNPVAESTWGPITGERNGIDSIRETKGVVTGECHVKYTSYSQDALHLLLEEVTRPGHKIFYSYIPQTDLLSSKYEVVEGKICRRSFFFYDQDGILITKFFDDGSSKDPLNLQDVTERHITRIEVRQDNPGRGQPEKVEELYLDNGQEIIKNRTSYTYAPNDLKASETHDGYTLSYIYDEKDRVIEETDKLGVKHFYQYDANNNIIYEQHRPDTYIQKEYDLLNRLVVQSEVHSDGRIFTQRNVWNLNGQLIKEYDALGRCKEYAYDPFGNIISVFNGSLITRAYDVLGHIIEETDPDGHTTKKRWNIFHQPLEITYADGGSEKFFYTLHGALKKRINKDGSSLHMTIDPLDRITKEELRSTSGEVLQARSFTYNALHLIEETDNAGIITSYYYDAAGRVKEQVKDAAGLQAHMYFTYDASGEVLESRTDYFNEITLRNTLGQVIEERLEDLEGHIQKKTVYGYDTYGHKNLVREYADARTFSETYTEYDSRNEIVLIINPEGYKTRFNYKIIPEKDYFVLQKSSTDPLGNLFVTTFDAYDRPALEERFNAAGHKRSSKELFYTKGGAKSRIDEKVYAGDTLLRTYSVTWDYTPLKKVAEEIRGVDSGDERRTTFTYNVAGDLLSKTLPNGTIILHSYDAYGRLESTTTSGELSYHFSYNKQGKLLLAGKTERSYNSLGHLLSEKLENGLKIIYERDLLGRKTSMTLPDSSSIKYFYEGYFLKSIQRGPHTQTVANRNWFGQICSMEGPLKITKTYDSLKRVQSIASTSWSQTNISFDKAGNFLQCHIKDTAGHYDCIYAYDDLYQITYEKSLFERHYLHDSLYNRISVDSYPQTINALNELTEDANAHYSWDKNGRLLSQNSTLYRYDELDRLIAIEGTSTYSYDSFNRRLSKTVGGLTTYFIYDGQNEIGSYEESRLQDLRILGDGLGGEIGASWAMEIEGEAYFPVHDNRGNVVSLQDASGEALEDYRYSSFGEEAPTSALSPWRFASKRVDRESGFVYFGRRYYSPSMGRWTTADPQGLSDGLNVYAYLRNNPVNSFDVYGLFGKETFNRMDRMVTQQLRAFMNSWFMQMASRQIKSAMSALKTASFGLKKMVNAMGRGIELLGRHVVPIPYLNRAVESLGSFMAGREKPAEEYHSQLYQFNADAKTRGVRDIIVNGMNTSFEDAFHMAKSHADTTGHYTTLVYNASNGAVFDICDCVANFFGAPTTPVRLLQDVVKRDVQAVGENGRVNVIAHSQGGLIAHIAAKQLPPSVNLQLDIHTIGSAKIIQRGPFENVANHVSSRDPIPWIADPMNRLAGAYLGTVSVHPSLGGFIDHSLDGETYKQVFKTLSQDLKTQYQDY